MDWQNVVREAMKKEPTVPEPNLETLEQWMWDDGGCEATDGCWVEPDGVCSHGYPSWLLHMGLI